MFLLLSQFASWASLLRAVLHVPHGAWLCYSASEWGDHSSLSRLATHHDERALQHVHLPELG